MSTVLNARGVPLSYSGAADKHISIDAGPTVAGSARNDSFWGNPNVTATLEGGAGDDVYHIYSRNNRPSEQADEGIDTLDTWMSYRLPDHIENLTVTGSGRFAFGNAMDNIVTGGAGRQTLDGSAGDDVLVGRGGSDLFIVTRGNGSDLILDLGAEDIVRLDGYGFSSFAEVRAKMSQRGDDLVLDLGAGEILVLADTTADDLDRGQFQLTLDLSDLSLTFEDDFDSLDLWNGEAGTWDTNFWWGAENGSSLTNNGELQWYIDHDYAPTGAVDPFDIDNGILTITAAAAPAGLRDEIDGYQYTSGMLTSYESFSQTYGYFEIRADMPEGQGLWPSFWMLPADGAWPPELDVIEMRGQNPSELILTSHSNETGSHVIDRNNVDVADTSGFHDYGVLWDPEHIVWYFDGVEVARTDTPADMHGPMYMIVNLAVGGIAGAPADGLSAPGEMKVDHLRAYALDGLAQPPRPEVGENDTILGTAGDDVLIGGAGDDLLEGRAGADRLYGGAGDDLLRGNGGIDSFDGGIGNDTLDLQHTTAKTRIDLAAETVRIGGNVETAKSIENAIGSYGNDTLLGDAGANALDGGHSRDRLVGREGDDVLTGGSGTDTFVFTRMDSAGGDGHDRITDFHKWSEVLRFRDLADADGDADIDLDDLLGSVTSVTDSGAGQAVTVAFDNGSSVTFDGLGTGQIQSLTDLVKDTESQILVS